MNKFLKMIRWFYPGLRVKRWIILFLAGVFLILISSRNISTEMHVALRIMYQVIYWIGVGSLVAGIAYFLRSFFEVIYPHKEKGLIDIIYEKRFLAKGPKIVTIGGGTGLSTILEGLKEYTSNISAIVTVADEGGSSGRLREEFGILPPGDLRNCLVSLAEAPQLMRDLFQYRFQFGEGMKGHNFGNLFITALAEVTGSFEDAIKESSKVLAIRGSVIPASLDRIRLRAEYSDGSIRDGEDKIPKEEKPIKMIMIQPPDAKANPEAVEALREAEIIIIGPGSLFTSVLPNLLISGLAEEMEKRDAVKIYICNIMTQHGETDGFTAADHVEVIRSHIKRDIINYCVVNSGRLDYKLLFKYAQEKSFPVIPDKKRLQKVRVVPVEDDLVSRTDYLRHDPHKIVKKIITIYNVWKKKCKESKKSL